MDQDPGLERSRSIITMTALHYLKNHMTRIKSLHALERCEHLRFPCGPEQGTGVAIVPDRDEADLIPAGGVGGCEGAVDVSWCAVRQLEDGRHTGGRVRGRLRLPRLRLRPPVDQHRGAHRVAAAEDLRAGSPAENATSGFAV